VPTRDSCIAAKNFLFDHLVCADEQQQRHGNAEQDHRPASRIFRPPDGIPLLKPGPVLRRYPWKNVVFLQSGKRF
jgi:hypothetical protein